MLTVFGIRQCDTCRKALTWLDGRLAYRFHDLRADGLQREQVASWLASDFAEVLINKRSTTWRQLSESDRQAKGHEWVDLVLAHPTLIKRPVFVDGDVVAVGFGPQTQKMLLGA